jgi:hypothetical protein
MLPALMPSYNEDTAIGKARLRQAQRLPAKARRGS